MSWCRRSARPDGALVPDERLPQFHVPAWVALPAVPRRVARPPATRRRAEPFPYDVTAAVHFSNGGGVYLATSCATGERVVVKEARPHAGLDADGIDAVDRLEREHRNLVRLAGLECVPAVHELRRHWEHTFLVEELVDGPTLNEEMVQRFPLIHPSPSSSAIAAYREWALAIVEQLDAAVDAVHSRGVVLGDLHPRNVLLRPDGRICLIDLELAHDVDEPWRRGMGAPGVLGAAVGRRVRRGPPRPRGDPAVAVPAVHRAAVVGPGQGRRADLGRRPALRARRRLGRRGAP